MRLGIDLGGTKIAAVVLDAAGRAVWSARRETPRGDYDATLQTMAALVAEGERQAGEACSVGLGTPGALSPATGLIKNANSTWLNGRPLKADLERALGRAVRVSNDANCLAASEARDGAGAGARVLFGVILGTGVGGGLVVDGRPLDGANAIAGEWGHNPLPVTAGAGPPQTCGCGRSGCIESWLNGAALARDFQATTGRDVDAAEVARLAQGGDPDAQTAIGRYEQRLALALAGIINILDPDVIVLGGGLASIASIYARVPVLWRGLCVPAEPKNRLLRARFGPESGLRGAAWLGAAG
jgi:fructokinase